MKSLNKTDTPIFLFVVCFFVSKGNFWRLFVISCEFSTWEQLNSSQLYLYQGFVRFHATALDTSDNFIPPSEFDDNPLFFKI